MSYIEREEMLDVLIEYDEPVEGLDEHTKFVMMEDLRAIPSADVVSAEGVSAAVDEALRVLNDCANQMDGGAYLAVFDAIAAIGATDTEEG